MDKLIFERPEGIRTTDTPSPAFHTTACPYEHEPNYEDVSAHHERCEWRQCSIEERAWLDHGVWKLMYDLPYVLAVGMHVLGPEKVAEIVERHTK